MDIEQAKNNMLTQQIRTCGVLDEDILNIIQNTPREKFVPELYKNQAFADLRIPLDHNQCMLYPEEEAKIIHSLAIKPTDIILEIGTGSGYMTALLAQLGKLVFSVDIHDSFIQSATRTLAQLGLNNTKLSVGDASLGWPDYGPYDVIVITGGLPRLPDSFRSQLKEKGRLFAIIGKMPAMSATLLTYQAPQCWKKECLFETKISYLLPTPQETFEF